MTTFYAAIVSFTLLTFIAYGTRWEDLRELLRRYQ
jgi:hypothetical protein